MIPRRSYSRPVLSAKVRHRPLEINKKNEKKPSKCSDLHKKIPKIIDNLQRNLLQLKKCYEEQYQNFRGQSSSFTKSHGFNSRHYASRQKSTNKDSKLPKIHLHSKDDETNNAEFDEVKKSYLNTYGYETNNVVELYNFYRKNIDKSTGLFGSYSYSNHPNSVNNFSDVCQSKLRTGSALLEGDTHISQNVKQNIIPNQSHAYLSKPGQNNDNLIKKSSQLVNVASLLAQRKQISRNIICEKMNQNSLITQAKKKLVRPNTKDNIQRTHDLITHPNINQLKLERPSSNSKISKRKFIKDKSTNTSTKKQQKNLKEELPSFSPYQQNASNNKIINKTKTEQQKFIEQINTISQFQLVMPMQRSDKQLTDKIDELSEIHKNFIQQYQTNNNGNGLMKKQITEQVKLLNKMEELPKQKYQKQKKILHATISPCRSNHSNRSSNKKSKSKSKSKSKQKQKQKSSQKILTKAQQTPDLNKGVIFEDSFSKKIIFSPICADFDKKQKNKKIKGFPNQCSLDGLDISIRQDSIRVDLQDIPFDF